MCSCLSVDTQLTLSLGLSVSLPACVSERQRAQPNPIQPRAPPPPSPKQQERGAGGRGASGVRGGGRWLLPANTEHPTVAGWLIHWLASCLLSGLSACGLHHSQQVQPQCFAKLMGKRHVYKPKCFPWQESLSHARQQIRTTQVKPQ